MVSRAGDTGPAGPDRQIWLAERQARVQFIGIGAQKCASTWVHDRLAQHDGVCLPSGRKEVDFFSGHYDFGFQWYESRFAAATPGQVAGEISPSYLHTPGVAERVAAYNPYMRIVLVVRDPIQRALSNHKHEVRIGHFSGADLSFEAGLANNPAYIEQGLYARHLKRWLDVFPAEQICVIRFDDVLGKPAVVLATVCAFLGLAPLENPDGLTDKSNESYLSRYGWAERGKNALRATVRGVGLGPLWQRLGDTGLRQRYRSMNRVAPEASIGKPLPDTIERLRGIFAPDVAEFARLTGLSVDGWLR